MKNQFVEILTWRAGARRRNLMSPFKKSPFLVSVVALLAGAAVTTAAFSAPKPDAPEVVPAKVVTPKKVMIRSTVGATKKNKTGKTVVLIKARPKPAAPIGLKATVIDEPNVDEGTVSVVTDQNEFATIATGPGTRIARGYQLAAISNLHTGYTIRCQGGWDRDGYQYQANRISIGSSVNDIALTKRIADACARVKTSRKSGGFGQSLVAMIPTTGLPKAMSIGGKPTPTPSPVAPAAPAPTASPVAPTNKPVEPNPKPIDPSLLPLVPQPTTSPAPATNPTTTPATPSTAPASPK